MRVLMVCLGNICRSPLAEGILQHKIVERGLDWTVDSAGTGGWHVGELPDRRSIAVAKNYGVDITNQRARQFTAADFTAFDRILVMDSSNYQNVLLLAPDETAEAKVELLLNYSFPNQNRAVPDPYWDNDGFEQVYQLIDTATTAFIKEHI